MSTGLLVRLMRPDEALEVACLVRRVFDACVAPCFEEQGRQEMYTYIEPGAFRQRSAAGEGFCWVALGDEGRIVGMLAQRGTDHISLFFVETDHQRHGVGRALLQAAFAQARTASEPVMALSVHAAPNIVGAYERLGFVRAGEEQLVNGIRFVPMRLALAPEERPCPS